MCPSRAVGTALILILSIVATNNFASYAFVPPSPFTSKHVARRLHQEPPTVTHNDAIYINTNNHCRVRSLNTVLHMAATAEDLEKEISAMRVKEIRQELESYGISTKSFFEKSEMVDALVKARLEGKTPIIDTGVNGDAASSDTSSSSSSDTSTSSNTSDRTERIAKEMEKCSKMKVGELKKELESYGVSTKSFFEKSEFVRAVAEARVDGPPKSSSSGSSNGAGGSSGRVKEEPRDPSFRDVIVTKFNGNKALLEGKIIDVRAR